MSDLRKNLKNEFTDPDYRYAYAESFLNTKIATQIKTLREQRGKKQAEIGALVGTKQSGFSRFEDVNHSVWRTDTLWKIARALGVRLNVSFETFGSLIDEKERFTKDTLERASFEEDPAFKEQEQESLLAATGAETKTQSLASIFGPLPDMTSLTEALSGLQNHWAQVLTGLTFPEIQLPEIKIPQINIPVTLGDMNQFSEIAARLARVGLAAEENMKALNSALGSLSTEADKATSNVASLMAGQLGLTSVATRGEAISSPDWVAPVIPIDSFKKGIHRRKQRTRERKVS